MWLLGPQLESSARTACAFNCLAISSAPGFIYSNLLRVIVPPLQSISRATTKRPMSLSGQKCIGVQIIFVVGIKLEMIEVFEAFLKLKY